MSFRSMKARMQAWRSKTYRTDLHAWAHNNPTLATRAEANALGRVADAFRPRANSEEDTRARYQHVMLWLDYQIEQETR